MKELPISVVISALVKDNRILLIKRFKGDYIGLLGLPGGKIEKIEHLSQAAVREIREETGIESVFSKHLGFVSEHLKEDENIVQHFLLHVCELEPLTSEIKEGVEGEPCWFDMDRIHEIRDKIIPSDFLIIEKMIKNGESNYYECVIEKNGNNYDLKKFESQ